MSVYYVCDFLEEYSSRLTKMNFDAYVNHISQKYRIAVAISVIKSKPNNLSIDEYLTQLQRKIKDMESDPNETVCSDDFNFDDEFTEQNRQHTSQNVNNSNKSDYKSNETLVESTHEFLQEDSQCSQTILNGFVFGGDNANNDINVHIPYTENGLGYTINLLKEVSDAQPNQQPFENHQNLSQITYCESQDLNINNDYNNDLFRYNIANNNYNNAILKDNAIINNVDSQETELYTLEGYTQNYTHVSQTQDEQFIVSEKYIRSKVDNDITAEPSQETTEANENGVKNTNNNNKLPKDGTESYHMKMKYDCKQTAAPNDYNERKNNRITFTEENATEHDHNINTQYDFRQINAASRYNEPTIQNNNFNTNKATEECLNVIDYTAIANDIQETSNKENNINNQVGVNKNFEVSDENFAKRKRNFEESNEHYEECNEHNEGGNEMEVDERTDSDDNSQAVKVPFKILEELNRVKAFVNKKDRRCNDGYSTDSGYRSDSQVRSAFKNSSQSTMVWVNQSAYCLFSYIMEAPIGFGDIINEISQVLGQLIDKLHEEENYPPFLEELLETVDNLIKETHEGCSGAENVILTKDGNTHRLVLLNKSKHILKHSIEIITNALEKLHTNLTQENLYEHTNTSEMENTCYIFHILEIFLKKYIKVKNVSSQVSTQNSQEDDRFPKRSSLTDLWRKKWNPNYKEMSILQENVTVCVLKKCSEVLNKIIVECMDGYSLISFSALQCFNLIQL